MLTTRAMGDAKSQIRSMLKEQKYPEARMFATQIIKLRKGKADAELYFLRGTACAHHSAHAQAEKDIRLAISMDPKCLAYHLTLINLLFSSGRYQTAFSEFARIRNRAPRNQKIREFARELNGRNGKLVRTIYVAEAELRNTEYKAKVTEQLASLYLVRAIFNWSVRCIDKRLHFYANRLSQVEDAEFYLSKIEALPVLTNTARKKKAQLTELIKISRKQRYDGFFGDWILAGLVAVIGFSTGGFIDIVYALSAVASFGAFMRSGYQFNRPLPRYTSDFFGRAHWLFDFAYGENINDGNKIFRAIASDTIRGLFANTFKALVRATLMPLAAFSGFWRNYGAKHAVVFAAFAGMLAYLITF